MTTTTTTATELAGEIFAQLDPLFEKLDGQILVSTNRWVDHLLDLYNCVELPAIRRVIEESLSDIRYLGSVEASWVREQLLTVAAAVEVESAFDRTAALIRS
jgi:hypothetical protein